MARPGKRHRRPPTVLVVGAGHAGLAAVHSFLALLPEAQITLFEPREDHLLKPRLLDALFDPVFPLTLPLAPLLASSHIEWVKAAVQEVGRRGGEVKAGGRHHRGDFVLLAAGARARQARLKGAFTLDSAGDVSALRQHLLACTEEARGRLSAERRRALLSVLVVGGGYTGVEAAGGISLHLRRLTGQAGLSPGLVKVTLVESEPRLGTGGVPDLTLSARVREALALNGVEVKLGVTARFGRGGARLGAERWPARTIVLAMGIEGRLPPPQGLPARRGRWRVGPDLRVEGRAELLVAGDAALVPGAVASAQHAVQEGKHAARVIEALWQGRTPPPLQPRTLGELVTVGDGEAIGWIEVAGRRVPLSGVPAAAVRAAAFARYLAGLRLGAARLPR